MNKPTNTETTETKHAGTHADLLGAYVLKEYLIIISSLFRSHQFGDVIYTYSNIGFFFCKNVYDRYEVNS